MLDHLEVPSFKDEFLTGRVDNMQTINENVMKRQLLHSLVTFLYHNFIFLAEKQMIKFFP